MKSIDNLLEEIKNQEYRQITKYLKYNELVLGREYICKNLVPGCKGFPGTGIHVNVNNNNTDTNGLESYHEGAYLRTDNGKIWRVNGDFLRVI